jgi:hypothetical protein
MWQKKAAEKKLKKKTQEKETTIKNDRAALVGSM